MTLRGILRLLVDLGVVGVAIACILHYSRRRDVACDWGPMRASCHVEVEDSLGRIQAEDIAGIRGAAYRHGEIVGLVTDAQNKDEGALFGTREVLMADLHDAEKLRTFGVDRDPSHIEILSGVRRPRTVTIAFFVGILVYTFVTRRLRRGRGKLARRDA